MTKTSATAIGFTAILLWGLLAYLSKVVGNVPPLQVLAMSFFIGGLGRSCQLALSQKYGADFSIAKLASVGLECGCPIWLSSALFHRRVRGCILCCTPALNFGFMGRWYRAISLVRCVGRCSHYRWGDDRRQGFDLFN